VQHSSKVVGVDYDLNIIYVGSRVVPINGLGKGTVQRPDGTEIGDTVPVKWDNGDDIYDVITDSIAVVACGESMREQVQEDTCYAHGIFCCGSCFDMTPTTTE